MAKKKKKTNNTKKYTLIELECANCGEKILLVKSCEHCGAAGSMNVTDQRAITQEELREIYENTDNEIEGDVRDVLGNDDEDGDEDPDISSLKESEIDEITLDAL